MQGTWRDVVSWWVWGTDDTLAVECADSCVHRCAQGLGGCRETHPACLRAHTAASQPVPARVLTLVLGFRSGPLPLVPDGLNGAHTSPAEVGVENRNPHLQSHFSFEERVHSAPSGDRQWTGTLSDTGLLTRHAGNACSLAMPCSEVTQSIC